MPAREPSPRPAAAVPGITFSLATGSYLISAEGVEHLIRSLSGVGSDHPNAFAVASMLEDCLGDDSPTDVAPLDDDRATMLLALEDMVGRRRLSDELFVLRGGLLKETPP